MKQRFHTLARPFAHRNYRLYFVGQSLSFVGSWMQSAAQAWLVYRLTGSAAMLGLVAFVGQIPVFLLAPIGGAYADRHGPRKVLRVAQWLGLALAATLAVLTFSHKIDATTILILGALLGIVSAFEIPARQALLIDLVGKRDLLNAVAMNSAIVNVARMLGPALAGALIAAAGEAWCFSINAISYFAMIGALARIRVQSAPRSEGSLLAQSLAGLRFVFNVRPIRALLLLLAVASALGAPYLVLMPVFATQILHGGPRLLGVLLGSAGTGALVGALLLASRDGARGLGSWVVTGCIGFGVSLIAFSQSRLIWVSLALLPFVGFFMIVQMAATNTLIQMMAPDRLRARVMAVYSMTLLGMAPLGGLIAGSIAHRIGAPLTLSVGGGVCVVSALVFLRYLPQLREDAHAFIVAQGASSGEPPNAEVGVVVKPHVR